MMIIQSLGGKDIFHVPTADTEMLYAYKTCVVNSTFAGDYSVCGNLTVSILSPFDY